MLLRVGNRIINTEMIVEARYSDKEEGGAKLTLFCLGRYFNDNPIAYTMRGDEADKVWNALSNAVEEDLGIAADQPDF